MLIPAIYAPGALASDEGVAEQIRFVDRVSVLGPVMLEIENVQDEDHVKALMSKVVAKTHANNLRPCYLEGLAIDQDGLATTLLDSGVHGVFFKYPTLLGLDTTGGNAMERDVFKKVLETFPRARVGLVVTIPSELTAAAVSDSSSTLPSFLDGIVAAHRTCAVHFYFQFQSQSPGQKVLDEVVAVSKALVEKTTSANDNIQVYIGLPREFYGSSKTAAKVASAMSDNSIHAVFKASLGGARGVKGKDDAAPASPTVFRGGDASNADEGIDILSAFISGIRSDRADGLFTTVVCDQYGVCLGLVYSNDVSICAAVFEKKGIYWSRSRGGLWRKGDSSGMHQELLSVDLDCDGDALRFTVIQHGTPASFCHLMTRTCWGDVHGFQHLQSILQTRLVTALPGSYTQRLFNDEDLLMKKLVEEAQELAEAKTHDEVAGEAADLMYFLMTRCVAAGVSLKDIENKLDARSLKVTRRQGNAKDYRTEAAAKLVPGSEKLQEAAKSKSGLISGGGLVLPAPP